MMWQIQKTSEKSTFSFAEFISGGGKIEKHYKDLTEKSSMSWTFLLATLPPGDFEVHTTWRSVPENFSLLTYVAEKLRYSPTIKTTYRNYIYFHGG